MIFTETENLTNQRILKICNYNIEYVTNYKFLGVTFDGPSLKWTSHVNQLKIDCNKRLSIMKSISHHHWGSDRRTMLMLHKALIQSKLDSASHLYHNASSTLTKSLEPLQNLSLRIATGLRSTTPVVSLQVEANVPSLEVRREKQMLKYYAKINEQPKNSNVLIRQIKHKRENSTYKGFFTSCRKTASKWQVRLPAQISCKIMPPIPPWQSIAENCSSEFCEDYKNRTDAQINDIFRSMIEIYYKDDIKVYTDGSKVEGRTGAALVIPELSIEKSYKLPSELSVLTTELIAILKAIKLIKRIANYKFVILSDSLSSINLIENRNPASYRSIIYEIQTEFLSVMDRLKLQWIPAHRNEGNEGNIEGNEAADRLAKLGTEAGPITVVSEPIDDYFNKLEINMKVTWKANWIREIQERNVGKALFEIKENIEDWSWSTHHVRKFETSIARLRVGHVGISGYLHRFGQSLSPLCEWCPEIETVKHFLLDCPHYNQERESMKRFITTNARIENPLTVKLLLGGAQLSAGKQEIIQSNLAKYLMDTRRINEL